MQKNGKEIKRKNICIILIFLLILLIVWRSEPRNKVQVVENKAENQTAKNEVDRKSVV